MTCWFCETREAESKKAIHLYMYGDMQSADTEENKKRITYSTKKIDVPRCAYCKKAHAQAKTTDILAIAFAVVLIVSVIAAIASTWVSQWVWGIALGASVAFIIMLLILKAFILRGIKKTGLAKKDYPQVIDLIGEGYKFGKNPSYEESIQSKSSGFTVQPKQNSEAENTPKDEA